jgi:hypothetical protein
MYCSFIDAITIVDALRNEFGCAGLSYVEIQGKGLLKDLGGFDKQVFLDRADEAYKRPDGSKQEGQVYKPVDYSKTNRVGSFKVVSNQYLLKTEK